MDAKQVWRAALGELQVSLSPANFETWLKETALVAVDDNRFRVAVPNGFAKDWLETRYRSLISQTLARVVGYSVQVDFEVREGITAEPTPNGGRAARPASPADPSAGGAAGAGQQVRLEPGRAGGPEGASASINSRYTFRNFIVGSANRLAHAASLSVAERPGQAYNPLFLYGGVGLGKTHLMHAIGNAVIARFPRKRVVYATSEKFTNEFITSIQQGRIDDFRGRYRRIDLLLIDDIQFIADKERTQEEFFHTFNAIHEDGKQIVLSSDRPPKLITTLEERLRSRFEWGLIADLTAPDLETRIAILRAKAEEQSVPIGSDVLEFIARKVISNIRELEGALNRIVAYANMGGMPISIELAQAVLSNVLYNPKRRMVTPERIAHAVSEYYGVELDALRGQKRDRSIVVPRQIAMYLMRAETDVSLLRIGQELGGRDHSTVLHACDKIDKETQENEELRRELAAVRELIYAD
ncbi:MAG TPA: chromosomal replication initiator protein DnaA [Candidatus Caenarcaniphilales bacterium]|nr:chromosomal replication initiator protein DnaA [Candidatus Caenarcaniphilales bacterium]